ncbi:hypothetical protein RHGRI_035481 [Rhododendron griersonianum]|uniref:Coenzyme Q-binding protein COQ10 START domain-containing protein n=1 Tax=Rhododendron griersonianum TaxID=479676 RepID=A0AAV6HK34_9ERIC|nr:hypothetical protein RHGRI_035481 [Rhododendron griersonianum]
MSATAIFISSPNNCSDYHLGRRNRRNHHRRVLFSDHSLILNSKSSSSSPLVQIFVRYPFGRTQKRTSSISTPPFKPFVPVMEWQESTVKMDINVPISVAYDCYSDREAIPRWMPFISSVKILEDKPDLSQWSLKYEAFGRDIEFSWLARNMQPIPNQKIHWRSLDGLPNRGAVRFFPRGPSSCAVELTVAYEVPQLLAPVASALKPFLENLLLRGLERFANFAKTYSSDSTK